MQQLSLKALQLAFMQELSGKQNVKFRALIIAGQKESLSNKQQRINIYRKNHVGARVNGLGNIYTVCKQILGELVFERLASDYVANFKSERWDLNFHGEDFYQFLTSSCQQIPTLSDFYYLPDLARLEWFFHLCYFADISEPVKQTFNHPEQLQFYPAPSLKLFSSQYPVYNIWYNNNRDEGDRPVVDDQECYCHVLIREQNIPQFYLLTQEQFLLLSDCVNGKKLGELANIHGSAVAENIPVFIKNRWLHTGN